LSDVAKAIAGSVDTDTVDCVDVYWFAAVSVQEVPAEG